MGFLIRLFAAPTALQSPLQLPGRVVATFLQKDFNHHGKITINIQALKADAKKIARAFFLLPPEKQEQEEGSRYAVASTLDIPPKPLYMLDGFHPYLTTCYALHIRHIAPE